MRVAVVEKPLPFVSLGDVKKHLKIEGDDEDTVVTDLIAAACRHVDGPKTWLGRALGVQVLEAHLDGFGACPIRLPGGDVIEVIEVGYLDGAGAVQTVAPDVYELRGNELAAAWGRSWPAARWQADAVRIRFRAGFGKLAEGSWKNDVPADARIAVTMHVGAMWRGRGDDAENVAMPKAAEDMLSSYRIWSL